MGAVEQQEVECGDRLGEGLDAPVRMDHARIALIDAGEAASIAERAATETSELHNSTADARPIHIHEITWVESLLVEEANC